MIVVATAWSMTGVADAASRTRVKCNGHAELCDRPLDQVAFAATHNAMASVANGFAGAEQARSIPDQLAGGIRALLLDVYTGTPTAGRVCTDPTPLKVAQIRRTYGQAAVDQLIASRNQQCPPAGGPTAALYLCHGFCELGAARFDGELRSIAGFLDDHPHDVVALMLEDYSPAADIMAAFARAGLARKLVHHRAGAPWPTLRQLTTQGKQLVVFAQHQGGTVPGLLDEFAETNETPYSFKSIADFTCAPNRGPARARLFFVNHWIDTPDVLAAAKEANTYPLLDARVEQCEQERKHLPNFVAVNFAEEGDLLRVVDELNGFAATP